MTYFTGRWRPSIPGWGLPAIGAAKELLVLGKFGKSGRGENNLICTYFSLHLENYKEEVTSPW